MTPATHRPLAAPASVRRPPPATRRPLGHPAAPSPRRCPLPRVTSARLRVTVRLQQPRPSLGHGSLRDFRRGVLGCKQLEEQKKNRGAEKLHDYDQYYYH